MATPAERFMEQVRWAIPCCPNCEHFSKSVVHNLHTGTDKDKEYCVLDKQQRCPPAKIIAFGCPRFVQDMPF